MRVGKAAGPSEIVVEMLKAAGNKGVKIMTKICNHIVREGAMPREWELSTLIPIYKGKGDPMECGSYRAIKLLEHRMKVLEKVLGRRLRMKVNIDDMQFGFMSGKGTVDAIFIVRQLQEKFMEKRKDLFYAFVDLVKAFDRVPRDVVRWALRQLGVEEWLVQTVGLENKAKKLVKEFLEKISDVIEVKPDKEGNGLYLNPYRRWSFYSLVYLKMTEHVYPKLPDSTHMEDKSEHLKKELAHYKKIKSKWTVANTKLRICDILVTGLLAGASVAVASLSIPIASFILAGDSIASITFTESMIEGFTGKRKRYFRQKCDYIKGYVNKLEILLLKIKEDGQVTPTEFKLFKGLLKEYESGKMNSKSEIKSKDVKKV